MSPFDVLKEPFQAKGLGTLPAGGLLGQAAGLLRGRR
jgi:hypothetical protein